MAADPITATLLLASAASTGAGLYASRNQEKLDTMILKAETAQAKLAGAETALLAAKDFRSSLASQLALSSLRSGAGGSLVRQFGSESMANFLQDQGVLQNKQKYIDISSNLQQSQIRANRFSRDVSSIGSLLQGGLQAINLNK